MNPFILLSLMGGLLAVDHRAGWQSLVAQPVFAALFVGLVTGQVAVALPVGLVLELIWLSILPMRGTRRPDQILGAIVGAGSACLLAKLSGDPRIVLISSVGAVLGLIVGELGGFVSNALFGLLDHRLSRVEFGAQSNRRAIVTKLLWLHTGSMGYIFAVEAMLVFIGLTVGFNIAEWFTAYTVDSIADGAVIWSSLVPALGAAAVIQLYWRRQIRRVLVLSSVMVILVLWLQ